MDGFDQDEAESNHDERAAILRRFSASKCDTLEAFELGDSDISLPYLFPRIMAPFPRIMAMTMMAVCRAPSEVMVTIVMAMAHYTPVPWSWVVVVLVVYYRRANWQWHCWLWRDRGGVETNMQIKLAIIFFKHVFQCGHKIIPLASAATRPMPNMPSNTRSSRTRHTAHCCAVNVNNYIQQLAPS